MKLTLNIPKRRGSCTTTRNGALLDAARSSCLDWSADSDRPLERIRAKQQLRDRLALSVSDLNDYPHSSFAEHQARGVFGGFEVLERRGFWRIEWECGE